MLEPVLVQGDRERLAPTALDFYCVHRTALNMLPPAETFPILRKLCMALLRAAVAAASTRKASHAVLNCTTLNLLDFCSCGCYIGVLGCTIIACTSVLYCALLALTERRCVELCCLQEC
jgi:hypothetical protein